MSGKSKHDQISISTVNAMPNLRVVVGLRSLSSDKVENLMFTFAGHESIGEDE